MYIFAFRSSSCPSNSFAMLLFHSAFLLCSLGCHILVQNNSVPLASGYWYICVIFPNQLLEFPIVVLELPVFLYCFTLSLNTFYHLSFASIYLLIFSSCIIIINILLLACFFFHESLSDSKSSQVSRTLLSIMADLVNALV